MLATSGVIGNSIPGTPRSTLQMYKQFDRLGETGKGSKTRRKVKGESKH